jgi:hypothetical protein
MEGGSEAYIAQQKCQVSYRAAEAERDALADELGERFLRNGAAGCLGRWLERL